MRQPPRAVTRTAGLGCFLRRLPLAGLSYGISSSSLGLGGERGCAPPREGVFFPLKVSVLCPDTGDRGNADSKSNTYTARGRRPPGPRYDRK